MRKEMSLRRFLSTLENVYLDDLDDPLFTLVLGAGASCSAGVPLTCQMVDMLREYLRFIGFPLENSEQKQENELAWLLSTLDDCTGDNSVAYNFILACMRRAQHEPNVTHLVAAALACRKIFRTIVTTNFDDLLLAAFWALPSTVSTYNEPFILYDPESIELSKLNLSDDVPIIIKAHGHHTQYSLGIANHYVQRLAPYIKNAIRWTPRPKRGYMVVGYSGTWRDGVMEALKDSTATGPAKIYWFYRERFVEEGLLAELCHARTVYSIRCDDSDALFLEMLRVLADLQFDDPALLVDITPALLRQYVWTDNLAPTNWWHPKKIEIGPKLADDWNASAKVYRRCLNIADLRRELIPNLVAIEQWDAGPRMRYDCLPDQAKPEFFDGEPVQFISLYKRISPLVPWTRRNLKLLRLALDETTDSVVAYGIFSDLDRIARTAASWVATRSDSTTVPRQGAPET